MIWFGKSHRDVPESTSGTLCNVNSIYRGVCILHVLLPQQQGMNCFSSDRSQQKNLSRFGRLTQTFPVVVAFNRKYVLRFKLTARATCREAKDTGAF